MRVRGLRISGWILLIGGFVRGLAGGIGHAVSKEEVLGSGWHGTENSGREAVKWMCFDRSEQDHTEERGERT